MEKCPKCEKMTAETNHNNKHLVCYAVDCGYVQIPEDDVKILRKLLWLHHGHFEYLYGDDGELQCGKCLLDFKRDPIEVIEKRFNSMAFERMIRYFKIGK